MKWLSIINLSLLISNVASLGIILQPQTIVGGSSLCLWTRNATDPPTLDFDLRFVQNVTDVGLALANLRMDEDEQYGSVSITFPAAGQYFVKAVSGSPRNTVVGTSNEVTAVLLTPSSTTLLPSSSASPSPSSSIVATMTAQTTQPAPSMTPVRSKRLNGAAIAGGVIGVIVVVGLLAALIVYISRRKDVIERRWSFHRDSMVRRPSTRPNPPTVVPNMLEVPSNTPPEDVEQGPPSAVLRPLGSGHVVPSPKGPRPSVKQPAHIQIVVSPRPRLEPAPPRTRRQQEIFDRIFMLRGQMVQVRSQPDTNHILDNMQRQIVWLRDQEQSQWALHKTDVVPPGHARYMTP